MGTNIRPEISKNKKYWISKHQYYELKHFCLQYREWKNFVLYLEEMIGNVSNRIKVVDIKGPPANQIEKLVERKMFFENKMALVEKMSAVSDNEIGNYIFKAVTEGRSFDYLRTKFDIPCGRDMYYDRYRKFFWLLSKER